MPEVSLQSLDGKMDSLEIELRFIRETLIRIEDHLEKQNGRLRVVEQEQARQGVYSGFIAAGVGGLVVGITRWLGLEK